MIFQHHRKLGFFSTVINPGFLRGKSPESDLHNLEKAGQKSFETKEEIVDCQNGNGRYKALFDSADAVILLPDYFTVEDTEVASIFLSSGCLYRFSF